MSCQGRLLTAALAPVVSHHLCQTGIVKLIVDIQISGIADKGIYGALLQIHYPDLKTFILCCLPILLEELHKWL